MAIEVKARAECIDPVIVGFVLYSLMQFGIDRAANLVHDNLDRLSPVIDSVVTDAITSALSAQTSERQTFIQRGISESNAQFFSAEADQARRLGRRPEARSGERD